MEKTLHSRQYKAVKKVLRELRSAQGITQLELATRLRTRQSEISKCEAGERRLDIIELWRWCRALDTTLPRFVEKLEAALKATTTSKR